MNWVIASLLMFLSSVALYLFVRRSNQLKTPQQLNNLSMFLIPLVVYVFLAINSKVNLYVSIFHFVIIIIQSVFFSYLGNVFSLRGIEYAPNPGYSLIISKSYVVFTAIASIFLFDSPLTFKSIVAIGMIMLFSAVIMIDKSKDKRESDNRWLPYTIGAFFCAGLLALSTKYLLNLGVPILTRLIYSMLIVTILILSEIRIKKVNLLETSRTQFTNLLMIGLSGAIFMYFMQVGFNLAPNVGYINAVNSGSISLLTLMSTLIFKDELNLIKIFGIIGVTIGLMLLFL